jgi:hypothetical protein
MSRFIKKNQKIEYQTPDFIREKPEGYKAPIKPNKFNLPTRSFRITQHKG